MSIPDDLGAPISYLVLAVGTPVFSQEGEEVGRVAHVLADASDDIFDGIVVDERRGLGGHRFAGAELIESIHERGVRLSASADEARALPAPSANPAVMRDDPAAPADTAASGLEDKLKRAWDLISGRG